MRPDTLAIDFGTSNSAVAVMEGGRIRRLTIEGQQETLPTAVFFPVRGGAMRIGQSAADALIAGEPGRYMRALKSVLGTSLVHETRLIGGKRRSLAEIITDFLTALRLRAEAQTGRSYSQALSGRPVHFHSRDPERDARAEADLRECYHAAGFSAVAFMAEPEAAALASHALGRAGELGIIVDIGGGTSDFSVFRSDGGQVEILASHGIRLGGTDFDHALSMSHAMPLLGLGGDLRREFGPGLLPVPNAIFSDLATWSRIPFLYAPEVRREAMGLAKMAVQPERLSRLVAVLEHELGHELAFAVEHGKVAANSGGALPQIEMGFVEPGLAASLTRDDLGQVLAPKADELRVAMQETLVLAGVRASDITTIVLVGGSSLMSLVSDVAAAVCPAATTERSEAFTAVVDGLALATLQANSLAA